MYNANFLAYNDRYTYQVIISKGLNRGTIDSINVTVLNDNNTLTLTHSVTNRQGGIFLLIATGGATFSILISILLAKTPILRWYAPILGATNLLQITWLTNSTDGYAILINFGILIAVIVLLINLILFLCTINIFIKENIVTKYITSKWLTQCNKS